MAALIEVRDLSKSFPGVRALNGVSFEVEAGTCHALIGENGAGKSTLGKILSGLYQPDGGEILLDGKPAHFRTPSDASAAGIGIVHQELLFCENLSVWENMNLHQPPAKGLFYDSKEARKRATAWLKTIEADVDPDQDVGTLSVAKQQLVQIAGAIALGAKILIFDEPTSSLSQTEADLLMHLLDELKASGVTCLYVSHRLEEVFRICDRVTVLRDGNLVATKDIGDVDRHSLVSLMVGRDLDLSSPPVSAHADSKVVLNVEGLSSGSKLQDLSFEVREGEILGLAGLVGAGRTETLEALFGLDSKAQGRFSLKGCPFNPTAPAQALRLGVGLIPEDRKRHGLVLMMSARQNISLPILDRLASLGFLEQRKERELATQYFARLRVKAPNIDSGTAGLSGGNQQKLVLAKWVAAQCDVLLVDEPTRGVDVGAKAEIHVLLRELAAQGKAIVMVSSELPELLALSTRILVLREGRIVGEIDGETASEKEVMRMMAGVAVGIMK